MRIGSHMTRKGQPCDHIPSLNGDTMKWSPQTVKREDNGVTYFRVHFGSYAAPRAQWVREDNIVDNSAANVKRLLRENVG